MRQLLIQAVALTVIGAMVYGLSKLLRCRSSPVGTGPGARQSAARALLAVAVSMAVLLALMLVRPLGQPRTPGSGMEFRTMADLLSMTVLGWVIYTLPAGYCLRRAREPLATAGVSGHNLWQACAIGLMLGALACANRPTTVAARLAELTGGEWRLLLFYSMVGFGEEFLFRGYLQSRLAGWLGAGRGWLLAAAIFALVHLPHRLVIGGLSPGQAALATLGLLPVSLLLGFMMLRVQNVVAPALFHTFTNWASDVL